MTHYRVHPDVAATFANLINPGGYAVPPETFAGVQIVSDPMAPKTKRIQFRYPRSKKKRIQKKWRKDPRNFKDVNVVWIFNADRPVMQLFNFGAKA